MAFSVKRFWALIKTAGLDWVDDKAPRLSAALAYYTIFSLAPLLIIILAIIGAVWGGQSGGAQAQIVVEIQGLIGSEGAQAIEEMLNNASRPGSGGGLATMLGVLALIFGATGVFVQLQDALNQIWEVERKPGAGIKGFILSRLLSFGIVIGIGFLLLVSLVITAAVSALDQLLTGVTPLFQAVMQLVNSIISIGVITVLFAMIYKYLPDVTISWRDVWVGAFTTAVLFTIGKYGIGLYLGNSSAASTYGAAGSLVVLLLWIYYSAMILFFGAEVTQVYGRQYGSIIKPDENAVWIDKETAKPEKQIAVSSQAQPVLIPAPASKQEPSVLKRAGLFALVFFIGRFFGKRA